MAQLNRGNSRSILHTHEGAPARRISSKMELTRSVLACLLWENQFYETGEDIAERISKLSHVCLPEDVAALAIKARTNYKLRHAPLLLIRNLLNHPHKPRGMNISEVIYQVINRADELSELLSIYWKDKKQPLSNQLKKGLARAFTKFDAYQLAKYDREKEIRLRDILFLVHAKPINKAQEEIWKKLVDGTLESPDTWEVRLSSGEDKNQVFTDLLKNNRLGYLALLRNLRNMLDAKVDSALIKERLLAGAEKNRALPFRFLSAAKAAPSFEETLDQAMLLSLKNTKPLYGKTVLLIDNSGSMYGPMSTKSDLYRIDGACGLAILARGICEDVRVFAFSDKHAEVPARQGMALADAIKSATFHGSTYMGRALEALNKLDYDRIIVFTDEQVHDHIPNPKKGKYAYMINVASYKNGIGYGPWTNITGFSEAVINYIQESESFVE